MLYNDDSLERTFEHRIYGSDISQRAIAIAKQNVQSAGLSKYIDLRVNPLQDANAPEGKCLMVTNPPYGERITSPDIFGLYASMGTFLKHKFTGNSAWVISSHEECLFKIGLKPSQKVSLLNGSLECLYCKYDIFSGKRNEFVAKEKGKGRR